MTTKNPLPTLRSCAVFEIDGKGVQIQIALERREATAPNVTIQPTPRGVQITGRPDVAAWVNAEMMKHMCALTNDERDAISVKTIETKLTMSALMEDPELYPQISCAVQYLISKDWTMRTEDGKADKWVRREAPLIEARSLFEALGKQGKLDALQKLRDALGFDYKDEFVALFEVIKSIEDETIAP